MKARTIGLGIVVAALSGLLWTGPAPGRPTSSERAVHVQTAAPALDAAAPVPDRPMRTASLEYTTAVIALGVLGLLGSIGILCMPAPALAGKESDR
jgi:hypothetical protein